MDKEDIKAEMVNLEFEAYEKSGTDDDFNTWKLKKYVDDRMLQVLIGVAIGFVVLWFLSR